MRWPPTSFPKVVGLTETDSLRSIKKPSDAMLISPNMGKSTITVGKYTEVHLDKSWATTSSAFNELEGTSTAPRKCVMLLNLFEILETPQCLM